MTSADRLGLPADLQRAVDFHGHVCPGLVIGYRAAKAAAHALQVETSGDEELILIAENDSCSVDAFQVLLSTTFGKGNLYFRDHGKQVFTVGDRHSERAVRVPISYSKHLLAMVPEVEITLTECGGEQHLESVNRATVILSDQDELFVTGSLHLQRVCRSLGRTIPNHQSRADMTVEIHSPL